MSSENANTFSQQRRFFQIMQILPHKRQIFFKIRWMEILYIQEKRLGFYPNCHAIGFRNSV